MLRWFGAAFIGAVEVALPPHVEWDGNVQAAWLSVRELVTRGMIAGLQGDRRPSARSLDEQQPLLFQHGEEDEAKKNNNTPAHKEVSLLSESTSALTLVERSFEAARPRVAALGANFYDMLFTRHPDVKPLFRKSGETMHSKLVAALVLLVASLRDEENLIRIVYDLGHRHVAYGVNAKVWLYCVDRCFI